MLLKTIFVRFYKSFNFDYLKKHEGKAKHKPWETMDEKWFPYVQIPIEPTVTTVVGANESGKSHLLSAIEKAISGQNIKREDFCRYSPFFTIKEGELNYPEFGTEWTKLSQKDRQKIIDNSDIPKNTEFDRFLLFRTNRGIHIYLPSGEDYNNYRVRNNEKIVELLPHTFRIESKIALPDSVSIKSIIKKIKDPKSTKYELLEASRRVKVMELLESLNAKSKRPQSTLEEEPDLRDIISNINAVLEGSGMSDKETRDREKEVDLAYNLICKVAKIDPDILSDLAKALIDAKEGYANSILERINKHLAESLNFPSWWVQDRKFRLLVSARDHDLVFTIRDRTGTEYSFGERSSGLKYFLSYYIQYLAHEPHAATPEILLMDEPDAYLSSQAQQDLLKIFEKFSNPDEGSHITQPIQVVYVTHSPFLIDKNHAERIRVLEKGNGDEGTRVVKDAYKNCYEPLRSGLGAFVGETAFIGNCNLMVEGPADQILIAGAARYLRFCNGVSNLETLDLNHVTIVPAEGAGSIPYLVYLARGRDAVQPAVIVLLDSDKGGNDAKKELKRGGPKRKQLLKEDFILQIGDLAEASGLSLPEGLAQPIEIEDLVPLPICVEAARLYIREVCGESDDIVNHIKEEAINEKLTDANKTIFDAILACFKELPEKGLPIEKIEKVGFARSVVQVITDFRKQRNLSYTKKSETNFKEFDYFEQNFKLLFRRLNEKRRKAERKLTDEGLSQKIERLKQSFLQDNLAWAKREQATELLEDIEAILDEGPESEAIKREIENIRRTHHLNTDLVKPIENYEEFKEGLERIKYAGRLASQESEE